MGGSSSRCVYSCSCCFVVSLTLYESSNTAFFDVSLFFALSSCALSKTAICPSCSFESCPSPSRNTRLGNHSTFRVWSNENPSSSSSLTQSFCKAFFKRSTTCFFQVSSFATIPPKWAMPSISKGTKYSCFNSVSRNVNRKKGSPPSIL